MDFSGLVNAVRDFWNFIWPAAVCLALLLGVIKIIAPVAASRIAARVKRLRPSAESQISAFKSLKRFGFDKLVPVMMAFCLLFLMDVAKTMVVLAGEALPPNVHYRYDMWFLQHTSDQGLRCLWAHFDDAPSFNDFQNDVERALSEVEAANKDSELFAGIHNWNRQLTNAHEGYSGCKFFIAWSVLWALIEMIVTRKLIRPAALMVLSVVLFSIAGTLFLFRHIWGIEQEQYARVQAVEVFLFEKPPQCRSLTTEQQQAYDKAISAEMQQTEYEHEYRWWNVRPFDPYYLHWVVREVFKPMSEIGTLPRITSEVVQQEQGTESTLEEVQGDAIYSLGEAEASRSHAAEAGTNPGASQPSPQLASMTQTTKVVKSTITQSSMPRYAGKRILWVDDHPGNNTYEMQSFRSLGMLVHQTKSTEDALDALSREHYDLVITDMLRGTDKLAGYELLDAIRQRHIDTPLIIYSGSANPEYSAEAVSKGALGETNDPTALFQLVAGAVLKKSER